MKRALLSLALLFSCAPQKSAEKPPAVLSAPPAVSSAPDPNDFRSARPRPGSAGVFSYPTPAELVLPNGLRVLHVERPGRVVSLTLVVRHGASSVPEGKSGLAALTARMLSESTKKRSAMALAEAVESLGTSLGAGASRDDSRVSMTVLPADFGAALKLLAEVVTEPAFSAQDFDRVKNEWLDAVRAERQDPQRLAAVTAFRALNGPIFGAPVNGTLADLQRLAVGDLRDFHARAYTPDNSALIVVGSVDAAGIKAEVEQKLGAWRGKNRIVQIAAPPRAPAVQRVLYVDRPDAVQTAISAVQSFPVRSEPGYEAREILVTTLGGLFTSRLNTNLREQHAFTYGAFAHSQEGRLLGTLLVGTNVRTPVTADALVEIRSELAALGGPKPPTPEELTRSRADLQFSLGATLEHPSRIASTLGNLVTDGLPLDYYTRFPTTIQAVEPGQILAAAKLLQPNGMLIVLVGDQKQFLPALTKAGFKAEAAPPELSE
jgi:zinc protease